MAVVFRTVACDVVSVRVAPETMSLSKSAAVGGEAVVCEGVSASEHVATIKVSWVHGCCSEGVSVGNCTSMRVCEKQSNEAVVFESVFMRLICEEVTV